MAPTEEEIDAAYETAATRAGEPSRYPGMSYERGLMDALAWVTGNTDENPFEDED